MDDIEKQLQELCSRQLVLCDRLQKKGNMQELSYAIVGLRDLQEVLLRHQLSEELRSLNVRMNEKRKFSQFAEEVAQKHG